MTEDVQRYQPVDRPSDSYATAVTSADMKLAYSPDTDDVGLFLLGDINAFPEGQAIIDQWYEGTVDRVADSLVHNAQITGGDTVDLVVNHHPGTYTAQGWNDDDRNWLETDKKAIYQAITRHPNVGTVYDVVDPASSVTAEHGTIIVNGQEVDGYVNLHDRGEPLLAALNGDVAAIARGANAPTATWNTHDPVKEYTDKRGLLETAEHLGASVDTIYTPAFQEVETADDVIRFMDALYDDWENDPDKTNTVILKTDTTGTWGDNILAYDPTDIQAGEDPVDALLRQAAEEDERVRAKHNRPDDHHLFDETGQIMRRDPVTGDYVPATGIVEEAIAGTVEREGATYQVSTMDGLPYDVVPLSVTDPDTGTGQLQAVTVRAANEDNLNVNRNGQGLESFDLAPLHEAYDAFIGDELSMLAGRPVTAAEINPLLQEAAAFINAVRQKTAYDAEHKLQNHR